MHDLCQAICCFLRLLLEEVRYHALEVLNKLHKSVGSLQTLSTLSANVTATLPSFYAAKSEQDCEWKADHLHLARCILQFSVSFTKSVTKLQDWKPEGLAG